jgi:hypothetical protein
LNTRAYDRYRVDDGQGEIFGRYRSRGRGAQIGQIAAIEQDPGRCTRAGIECQHDAVVPSGEARCKFARVPVAAVQMTGFDMDLTSMLGYVEMDHAGQLGTAGRVRREGLLDRGNARGGVE